MKVPVTQHCVRTAAGLTALLFQQKWGGTQPEIIALGENRNTVNTPLF